MEAVVLTIHLLLAFALILVVLLQRSEGGGLGMGGGGIMTSRGAATALSKVTWAIGTAFVVTSLTLTVLAAHGSRTGSVIDRAATPAPGPRPGAGARRAGPRPRGRPAAEAAGRRGPRRAAAGQIVAPGQPLVARRRQTTASCARRLAAAASFPYRLSPVKPRAFAEL